MRKIPIQELPAFKKWHGTPKPDRAALARHQHESGVTKEIKERCCDGGYLITSDILMDEAILVSEWSEMMDPSDPLAGLFRPGTRVPKEVQTMLSQP